MKRVAPTPVYHNSLTRAGKELIEPMSALCQWGTRHLGIPLTLPRHPKRNGRPTSAPAYRL